MKKYGHIALKVLMSLLLISPILGVFGIFPPPTAEMYQTKVAFQFILVLMNTYVIWGIAITCFLSLISLWIRREALAALLILPVTANIIAFHAFLDGGLLTGGAIMGNLLLLINIYFLWIHRGQYRMILAAKK